MQIPAEHALILWNDATSDGGQGSTVTRVAVVDIRRQPRWAKDLDCSRGACSRGWMTSGHWRDTPLGLMAELGMLHGFASRDAKIAALREFAQIEGQDWAVEMLRELGEEVAELAEQEG
jgi:hypothetical protein